MPQSSGRSRPFKLDEIDLKILAQLQTSSKITNAMLAEKVGISPPSTLERVRKLENNGIINGYVALLNPKRLNKSITAIVQVSLGEHSYDNLTQAKQSIGEFDEVLSCWHTAGDQDFVLQVIVSDMQAYETFVTEKLSTVAKIANIKTAMVLRTVKDTTTIPLDEVEFNGSRSADS
ncbi:MAG: Lrp/AsnC family transcriptional regulator [Planctomycetota bacterium]